MRRIEPLTGWPQRMISLESALQISDRVAPQRRIEILDASIQQELHFAQRFPSRANRHIHQASFLRISPVSQDLWKERLQAAFLQQSRVIIQAVIAGSALSSFLQHLTTAIIDLPDNFPRQGILPENNLILSDILDDSGAHQGLSREEVIEKIGEEVLESFTFPDMGEMVKTGIIEASALRLDAVEVDSLTASLKVMGYRNFLAINNIIANIASMAFARIKNNDPGLIFEFDH